jgi:hypothetical protein
MFHALVAAQQLSVSHLRLDGVNLLKKSWRLLGASIFKHKICLNSTFTLLLFILVYKYYCITWR